MVAKEIVIHFVADEGECRVAAGTRSAAEVYHSDRTVLVAVLPNTVVVSGGRATDLGDIVARIAHVACEAAQNLVENTRIVVYRN